MKAIHGITSVLALLVAGSAFAGGGPYPLPAVPTSEAAKSRAEVVAELREAQRLGLMTNGEQDIRVASPGEERQIAEAGRRAHEEERLMAERRRDE